MGRLTRALLAIAWAGMAALAGAQERSILMASTTSTEQSGLFAHLLPAFKKATTIDVRVVAQGTGQALDMGRRGDFSRTTSLSNSAPWARPTAW